MSDVTGTFYAAETLLKHGFGAQLLVGDAASPEGFTAVALVKKITPGQSSVADVNRTHLRSPNNHAEHGAGLLDDAAWQIECGWAPGHESQSLAGGGSGAFMAGGLYYLYSNRLIRNFKLQLNDGSPATEVLVRGYLSQFQLGAVDDTNDVPLTISIMPSESPVFP